MIETIDIAAFALSGAYLAVAVFQTLNSIRSARAMPRKGIDELRRSLGSLARDWEKQRQVGGR